MSARRWFVLGGIAATIIAVVVLGSSLASRTDSAESSRAVGSSADVTPASPPSLRPGPEGGTPEWFEWIGAEEVVSPDEATSDLGFSPRLPDAIAGRDRDAIYVLKTGGAAVDSGGNVEVPDGSQAGELALEERQVYFLYGDVIAVQYLAPAMTDPLEWASKYDENTGGKESIVHLEVNGQAAVAWNAGTYDALSEDGIPVQVEHEASSVVWLQDGVIFSVTSKSGGYAKLLPFADTIAHTAPTE